MNVKAPIHTKLCLVAGTAVSLGLVLTPLSKSHVTLFLFFFLFQYTDIHNR